MLYPLTFQPIFKERVWGGRNLETLYKKTLPTGAVIGESWEISDRPGDESIITNGARAGKTLRWLMEKHADELMGSAFPLGDRFPLLVKILDARDKLSLQVHPPAALAAQLGGEPKTEMWYIADTEPGAELYAGLNRGVTRAEFQEKVFTPDLAGSIHRVPVKRGDVMFLPSGRIHAIGAGLVIFEIQQNSDTTYRVFDWNRTGLDGKPRELHIAESLASIDFNDFEPALVAGKMAHAPNFTTRTLVNDPLFKVNEVTLRSHDFQLPRMTKPQIIGLASGSVTVNAGGETVALKPGGFCLIPAALLTAKISATEPSTFLFANPT
jgi:mannose-6-phosphate isomerase